MDKLYYMIFEFVAGAVLILLGLSGLKKAEDKDGRKANFIMIGGGAVLLIHFVIRLCTGYAAGLI